MDDDDAAATQGLLDELARLDGDEDASLALPLVSLPPVDDVDILLADLLPRSPTAQFLTFFAAPEGDASALGALGATDEELLDFDLDLLGDGDEDTVSTEPLTTTDTIMPLKTKTKNRKVPRRSAAYDSNRARNERRHELAYLRRKVADMESELVRARTNANHETQLAVAWPTAGGAIQHHTRHARTGGRGIWEQIAGRQLDERHRAERDNVKLRAALELQLKVAKSLELILNKPALTKSLESIGRSGVIANRMLAETSMNEADKALLQKLLEHVEQIYAQTDALVRDSGAAPASTGVRTASNGSLAEIFATDLMPFTLDAASKAAWSYFSYKKNYLPIPSRLYYERHDVDNVSIEDTVLESSGMDRSTNGVTAIVKIKQVLRRYVEHDRVVIAWSAITQSVELNGQPFTSCDLREWGCMVLRPANASERRAMDTDDALAPLTVLRSCYFIAPEFRGNDEFSSTEHDIGRLTECVLAFTSARMATWRQRIENILLDEQLAASR